MLGIKKIKKTLSILVGVALVSAASILSAAASGAVKADLNVRGDVTVNGQSAVSNATLLTGSTITTGSDSGAVIGIGTTGRVELMPDTTFTIEFTNDTISGRLSSGGIRVSDSEGIGTRVTTPDAVIATDAGRTNNFSISDSKTGAISKGKLTVVSASDRVNITTRNGKVASLLAGESIVQDDDDDDDPGSGAWFIWALLLGGAAAGIIIAATQGDDIQLGGGATVISPNR